MKKFTFICLLVLLLTACCKESDIQECANAENGLSYETCQYLMCR